MTTPDIGPIDLQRILKTLTRQELEAYALINALTVDAIVKAHSDTADFAVLMIPHGIGGRDESLAETLQLGQDTTEKVQKELIKTSHRKN